MITWELGVHPKPPPVISAHAQQPSFENADSFIITSEILDCSKYVDVISLTIATSTIYSEPSFINKRDLENK